MVIGMDRRPAGSKDLLRSPGNDLVRIHVRGGSRTGLVDIHDEFAIPPPPLNLSGGLCDNPLFLASFPCEIIPLGRFVLLAGLQATLENEVKDEQ